MLAAAAGVPIQTERKAPELNTPLIIVQTLCLIELSLVYSNSSPKTSHVRKLEVLLVSPVAGEVEGVL